MCKLHIEDQVDWRLMLNILKRMGFGEKWIDFCVKLARFSVLVNGEPAGFFGAERGLRQSYPLRPFLLIVAMERFDSMMSIALHNDGLKGLIYEIVGAKNGGMSPTKCK